MAVQYGGDYSWAPSADPVWSLDEGFGYDKCTVSFRGSRLLKSAFLDSLKRFQTLAIIGITAYPLMRLLGANESGGTVSFPQVDCSYVGFRQQGIPMPKSVDALATISAQGSGTDPSSGQQVSGTITCQAPQTTWTWYETEKPLATPRYATVNNSFDPRTRVVFSQITASDGTGRMIPYSDFVTVFNSIAPATVASDYQREEILPGSLWACSCIARVMLF